MGQHFQADKNQEYRKSDFQEAEFFDQIHYREEKWAQTDDGKNVGEINNERVFGYWEDGRNRIDSENDIRKFDDQQDDKQAREFYPQKNKSSPKNKSKRNPNQSKNKRFPKLYFMVFFIKDTDIQKKQEYDHHQKTGKNYDFV